MDIVSAEPDEARALRDLHVATWELTYRKHAGEAWYRERLAAHAARDWREIVRSQTAGGGGVLTARCDGRVVALCQYGPTEDHDHDSAQVGQIQRLYVHPAHQGAGIGRSLLGASVDRLRHAGGQTATLWVLEVDERARAFYERLGWKRDGARSIGPPTDVRYRLALRRRAAGERGRPRANPPQARARGQSALDPCAARSSDAPCCPRGCPTGANPEP